MNAVEFFRAYIASYEHSGRGMGDFWKFMQTRDAVEGWGYCFEFSQLLLCLTCLHEAMQTRKKVLCCLIKP